MTNRILPTLIVMCSLLVLMAGCGDDDELLRRLPGGRQRGGAHLRSRASVRNLRSAGDEAGHQAHRRAT